MNVHIRSVGSQVAALKPAVGKVDIFENGLNFVQNSLLISMCFTEKCKKNSEKSEYVLLNFLEK